MKFFKRNIIVLGFLALFSNYMNAQEPKAVLLGQGVVGALYEPKTESPRSKIALLVMHAEGDYTQFSAGKELSERGYTVLNANNSASKYSGNDLDFERAITEIGKAVKYLKDRKGIEKVVLLGHSGGGSMFSAYQNIAENGVQVCQTPNKIVPCSDKLANLPKADGIILLDANYGMSTMYLLSLDPAISDENSAMKRHSNLNLYLPENGMTSKGATFSAKFKQRYFKAVAKRNNDIIKKALERKKLIEKGLGNFADDEPFIVPAANYMGMNNKLFSQDVSLLSRTNQAWKLVHKDGSITTEIVRTTRSPKNLKQIDEQYSMALRSTIQRFLPMFAIRVGDDFSIGETGFTGIDWESTHTSPVSNVKGINVPFLTVGLTGNWEYLNAEQLYLNAKSTDKDIVFIEGASHIVTPIDEKYGDTIKLTYDYIADWLSKTGRFLN
ncbi:MAG: DUF1749 domain-containing protein [Capnocytophaga sp.]|nr:DUF1749 domain-containing protein [Capnocytophaga sp.]